MEQSTQQRIYSIEAVILDWAGTTVDFGSLAPIHGFQQLFNTVGIELSQAQVRGPMGTEKREHIRQLCLIPHVAQEWQSKYGQLPSEQDVDRLYQLFLPIQIAVIAEFSQLIPGVVEFVAWAQQQQIKIAANTGYAREMIPQLLESAAQQGYAPQSVVCATEVTRSRPFPYMSMVNAMELGVERLANCVKVDDTQPGIDEGLNAGMWTIALAVSGNYVGLDLEQWQSLSTERQFQLRSDARDYFQRGGAHYVIDSIADIIPVLREINKRIAVGEKP